MSAVTGRVVDAAGRGVPGVWTYAVGAGGTHTDRDGRWTLHLPAGHWQIREVGHGVHDVHVDTADLRLDAGLDPDRPTAARTGRVARLAARRAGIGET